MSALAGLINIGIGDRWAVIGGTGSGKTVFGRELLNTYTVQAANAGKLIPTYILDTKAAGDFKGFTDKRIGVQHFGNTVPKLIKPERSGKPYLVWTPEEDNIDMYDAFFKAIYQSRRPAIVYVDELGSITNANATRFPRYYDILLKQGRGLNIGLISNTQSPAYVPNNLIRQATHLVRFRLNDDYDSKKLGKQLGQEYGEGWEPEDEHGFAYRNLTKPRRSNPTLYYKDFQEFFGLR